MLRVQISEHIYVHVPVRTITCVVSAGISLEYMYNVFDIHMKYYIHNIVYKLVTNVI